VRQAPVFLFLALVLFPRAASAQGDPLGPEFRVNTYTTNGQAFSAITSDASGNFVVVWESDGQDGPTGTSRGVFGQRYASSGTPLGPEFRVNTYTTESQGLPSIAADGSGNFVVVWRSEGQDGSSHGVFGQRYANSGTPLGSEFRVNTFTTGEQRFPSVAADTAGNFVAVWRSAGQDLSSFGIFGQRYASSGVPLGSEFRVNTYTTGSQAGAAVASDASGNFVVVWSSVSQDGSSYGVFGQRYAISGTSLGPEFRVNTYTTGGQLYPAVASDGSGNFVVVWQSEDQNGSGDGVYGQRYASSGTPLGPEFRINTYTAFDQINPVVASDISGNLVVVWTSPEPGAGASFGIVGQRYASSGAPSGPEFRVNTYTPEFQTRPAVTSDASGNFVVSWTSPGQDGSSYGIFGQRYSQIVPVELMQFKVE
jgi:hypothetical protein